MVPTRFFGEGVKIKNGHQPRGYTTQDLTQGQSLTLRPCQTGEAAGPLYSYVYIICIRRAEHRYY